MPGSGEAFATISIGGLPLVGMSLQEWFGCGAGGRHGLGKDTAMHQCAGLYEGRAFLCGIFVVNGGEVLRRVMG